MNIYKIIDNHLNDIYIKESSGQYHTVVINAFAGPGAGKTTACLEIAEKLKKQGYVVEYVQEYAKDLVWEENWNMLDGTEYHQLQILDEQMNRIDRLIGKTQFIVTDSPILLNSIYNNELTEEYTKMLSELYSHYNNFNFFVERDCTKYEVEGRLQTLDESIEKDQEVIDMLDDYQLYFGRYTHATVDKIVNNVIKTYNRLEKSNIDREEKKMDLNYSIKVNRVKNDEGNLKGFASIVFNDSYKINNIAICKTSSNKIFVSMPRKNTRKLNEAGNEIYQDICNPITAECRKELYDAILNTYDKTTAEHMSAEYSKVNSENKDLFMYDVSVNLYDNVDSNIKGYASLKLNDEFVINNITVTEDINGKLHINMPSYNTRKKDDNGKDIYQDICYPVSSEFRKIIDKTVLDVYQDKLDELAEKQSKSR